MSQELPTRSKFRNQYVDVIEEAMKHFPEDHYMTGELDHAATELSRLHRRVLLLTPPEGYVLVPVEPTEAMLDAGRAAVMAEHCAGPKWTPRQHFEASGHSTAGIPEDVLDELGPLTKESTAAMVFGAMLAARPEVP